MNALDPISAVTHADPYPYYAGLVARGLQRDERLGLWVAASAAAVADVLASDRCAVRPPAEPVPAAVAGLASGALFGRLVRMIDGPGHAALKPAVSSAVADVGRVVGDEARRCATRLARDVEGITDFAFRLPVHVVASALGAPPERVPEIAEHVGDYVVGVAPGATAEQVGRGALAAERLMDTFRGLHGAATDGPLAVLSRGAPPNTDAVVANAVGFLSQAYEATAGLIGNTLIALARHPEPRADVSAIVREVVRFDPPVQNTRRFVTDDGVVAGQSMRRGDTVLVVLAAANRDPAANPEPDRFDPFRTERTAFTFGAGPHACPGESVATAIAAAGVEALLAADVRPERLLDGFTYRPSVNTRVPIFTRRGW